MLGKRILRMDLYLINGDEKGILLRRVIIMRMGVGVEAELVVAIVIVIVMLMMI